jgi:hypothetical protein
VPLTRRRLRRRVRQAAVHKRRRDGGEGECHALGGRGGGRSEMVVRRAGERKGGNGGVRQAEECGRGNMRRICCGARRCMQEGFAGGGLQSPPAAGEMGAAATAAGPAQSLLPDCLLSFEMQEGEEEETVGSLLECCHRRCRRCWMWTQQ